MYILSQDKTRIYNMSGHIEGIGYEESKDYKGSGCLNYWKDTEASEDLTRQQT